MNANGALEKLETVTYYMFKIIETRLPWGRYPTQY